MKLIEEETAKRVEEAIRKRVEESLKSEEVQVEIERRLEEGRKRLNDEVAAQLEKEKEAALIEAKQKEVFVLNHFILQLILFCCDKHMNIAMGCLLICLTFSTEQDQDKCHFRVWFNILILLIFCQNRQFVFTLFDFHLTTKRKGASFSQTIMYFFFQLLVLQ